MNKKIKKTGFTLAETLITLVIIGVIAAITVPALITKYQKEQTVVRLKKAYSALSQVTNLAIADYGPMETWDFGEINADNNKAFLNKYVVPYMSVMTKPSTSSEGKWNNAYVYLDNTSNTYGGSWVRFYLNDGVAISANMNIMDDGVSKRLIINIDINGDKKPNKIGKDIFYFDYFIYSPDKSKIGKVYPEKNSAITREDLISPTRNWACNKNKKGSECSALIMYDGWRIADDYPW